MRRTSYVVQFRGPLLIGSLVFSHWGQAVGAVSRLRRQGCEVTLETQEVRA